MNIVLLDGKTPGDDVDLSGLERFGNIAAYPNTSRESRAERMRGADIVITNKVFMDKTAIDAAPSLKLICVAATGMNNVDLEYTGTDVVSTEPIASDSPLLNITHQERLSTTPHIAWSDTESRRRLIAGIETNIERFLSDRAGA